MRLVILFLIFLILEGCTCRMPPTFIRQCKDYCNGRATMGYLNDKQWIECLKGCSN